ncbi:MAG: mechanosensitive ion channel family protein [Gammaproteobacteria bacterium]|nr:mechanosensitive ion channel family protein [Gammaproteobacteria bacterium]MDH5651752.1 mechanosensitive ion channel family protein [Gammaproteobacteria bacterium]
MENYLTLVIEQTVSWLPRVGSAVSILLLFWLLVKGFSRLIQGLASRLNLDTHLTTLFQRGSRLLLWTTGLVTMLGTLGVDVTAMVAGLGLTGFAVGFALKDTISNMLSGILILLYRPFSIGDTIGIAGFDGEVISIDLRYTVIRGDEKDIFIPNSKLFSDPLTVTRQKRESTNQQDSNHNEAI